MKFEKLKAFFFFKMRMLKKSAVCLTALKLAVQREAGKSH